jgi:hypothetical protein
MMESLAQGDQVMLKKASTPVYVKCRETKRPYSGEAISARWIAAIVNMAAKDFYGNAIPSFRKPYFVMDATADSEADFARFCSQLEERGYVVEAVLV